MSSEVVGTKNCELNATKIGCARRVTVFNSYTELQSWILLNDDVAREQNANKTWATKSDV